VDAGVIDPSPVLSGLAKNKRDIARIETGTIDTVFAGLLTGQ